MQFAGFLKKVLKYLFWFSYALLHILKKLGNHCYCMNAIEKQTLFFQLKSFFENSVNREDK
jgi:hypothetical protein